MQGASIPNGASIMAGFRIKSGWIAGIVFALLFVLLFALRLGLFHKDVPIGTPVGQQLSERETWMNIFQKGNKIGYAHRSFSRTDVGYHILESILMRINTMGMIQDIRFKTEGYLNDDLTLASFNFELFSGLFHFRTRGVVNGRNLTIFTGNPDHERKFDISLKKIPHLGVGIVETVWNFGLREGQGKTFHVFDLVTMAERPVKVEVLGDETIVIMEKKVKAKKISVNFMGADQFAWLGEDGNVLKEEGILGISLERVTKDEAARGLHRLSGADLIKIASIPSNERIDNPDDLSKLKVMLYGIEDVPVFLDGGRQSLRDGVLTIRRESVSNLSRQFPDDVKMFLEPSPFIQSDHPMVKDMAKKIVSMDDPVIVKAKKLTAWVYEHVQKRPVISVPSAVDILRNLAGDCNEHAVLLAALARAAGIPAQVEMGIVYQGGRFYYHAWNVLYLGDWITVDSVMGQIPADVTHIRFVRGAAEHQIDLMGVIGKVTLEIVGQVR